MGLQLGVTGVEEDAGLMDDGFRGLLAGPACSLLVRADETTSLGHDGFVNRLGRDTVDVSSICLSGARLYRSNQR